MIISLTPQKGFTIFIYFFIIMLSKAGKELFLEHILLSDLRLVTRPICLLIYNAI